MTDRSATWTATVARATSLNQAFATAADRAGIVFGAGDVTYLMDVKQFQFWDGAAWQQIGGAAPANHVFTPVLPWSQSGANNVDGTAGRCNLLQVYPSVVGPVTVSKMHLGVGAASGSIDVGVYSLSGTTMTRVASAGGVACPAAGGEVDVNFTAPATLQPGTVYYLAVSDDNATVTLYTGPSLSTNLQLSWLAGKTSYRVGPGIGSGVSAYPLPPTIDLALGTAVLSSFTCLAAH